MKHNVDEATLMAYLYGELEATEKREVEAFLEKNPERLKEMEHLGFVQKALSHVNDKEVIAPPIFYDTARTAKNNVFSLNNGFLKYSVGIAAAFIMVMVAAKVLGVRASYSGNQLTVAFGEQETIKPTETISESQVRNMIDESMVRNNEFVKLTLNESQNRWYDALAQSNSKNASRMSEISKTAVADTQDQIRQFLEGVRTENNQIVQDYLRLSANDQKQFIENLLVDFSQYMQEQRKSDFSLVNTRLANLEQENSQFKEEASQILTSLISNSNNLETKRN